MDKPKKIKVANLPTKIQKLERLSSFFSDKDIYIKRDDQTGTELSGNKIRKLEYLVKQALDNGCDYLITCGGIQSNHARATACLAATLGIKSLLVLKDNGQKTNGNYFLDNLFGTEIKFITQGDYDKNRIDIMNNEKERLEKAGFKAFVIPEGASNGIGTFGYYEAMEEILSQEKELNIKFDAIVTTVGSGGTFAGLFYANKINKNSAKIIGINVCHDVDYFKDEISKILKASFEYTKEIINFTKEDLSIIDGYVGNGYALSTKEELKFISDFAKMEGIILDPVYTGKAMNGLVQELKKGKLKECKNILFIHTGGLFGLFPKENEFEF
ncbi:MAG: D-cysteine desulfhydrase family protein [Peptostreptococcaceae bacterium]|jgi:D-cysteine desulfhydrase|nr:D-cysteine desulfhydrase family protein [Peptostreptococcaceae bacterium]